MEQVFKVDIPARAEFVVLGRLALSGVLRERPFSQDAVADLKLALTEACSNSIRHAYGDADGRVLLSFTVTDERIMVEVRDEGAGFVEEADERADLSAIEAVNLSEGGMGISIIRAVVDEFRLERCPEGGSMLTITKLADA